MNTRALLAGPYLLWIAGFTIIPIFILIWYAFGNDNGVMTDENFWAIFDPLHLKALWLSLELSVLATVVCFLLAYPLVLCLRHLQVGRKTMLLLIVILPMWMNFVLRIMAWQIILSKNGVLNYVLDVLGLPPQGLSNSVAAIVIGMVYDYLPFMVLPIYNSVMDIRKDIIEAARDLGANYKEVLLRILLPLSLPGIISGITMVFVPALTTFAISDMLGGGKVMLIGNIIEQEFMQSMNWHLGSGLSLALMFFVLISMFFTFKADAEQKGEKML